MNIVCKANRIKGKINLNKQQFIYLNRWFKIANLVKLRFNLGIWNREKWIGRI